MAQLKGALQGAPAQILMGGQGSNFDYDELREQLQKCFGVDGHVNHFQNVLKTRRRRPNESLRSLYQDICHLCLQAYPGPQNELKDQLAVTAFIDSLDDPDL